MNLDSGKGNIIEELDPRMKFILVILITVFTFTAESTWLFIYYYALILVLMFTSHLYKKGIKLFVFIAIMLTIQFLGESIQNNELKETFVAVVILIQRISVFVAMGMWMTSRMKVGNFITALENMRVPKGMTITFAVVLRYIPTVRQEFYYIKNTMRLRGIGISFKNLILHPIKTFEYSFVPLIIRSMTIADELSASAMTRGLDLHTKRIPIIEVKIKAIDIIITTTVILLLVGGMILSKRLYRGLL